MNHGVILHKGGFKISATKANKINEAARAAKEKRTRKMKTLEEKNFGSCKVMCEDLGYDRYSLSGNSGNYDCTCINVIYPKDIE